MRKIILVSALLSMIGCSTLRKDMKNMAVIETRHPQLLADKCALIYPIKEVVKYTQGETKTVTDTVEVPGESIPCPEVINQKGDTIREFVKCPPAKTITKTIIRVDTITTTQEQTAKIASQELQIKDLNGKLASTLEKVTSITNGRNTWRNVAIGLIVLIGLGVFLKIKRII